MTEKDIGETREGLAALPRGAFLVEFCAKEKAVATLKQRH
jgi:hypothetical protein